jgi:hypothetical protein
MAADPGHFATFIVSTPLPRMTQCVGLAVFPHYSSLARPIEEICGFLCAPTPVKWAADMGERLREAGGNPLPEPRAASACPTG